MERVSAVPIGFVRSELRHRAGAPRQGRDEAVEAVIEVFPRFEKALEGIEQCSRLMLICWLHLADRQTLSVHPRGDPASPLKGVFGTRSPDRPNPAAVYTVDLLAVEQGLLRVRGIDALDGTPVLDIKPHVHRLDD